MDGLSARALSLFNPISATALFALSPQLTFRAGVVLASLQSNVVNREPSGARAGLTAIVKRAQAITNACGAALALATNHDQEIECYARSGNAAPPLGRSPLVENSLTALCLRRGQRLLCDDVEADPRVSSSALLELGVRSLVLTPVRQWNVIVGVLTVLADVPHAFSARHLAQLEAAAREISEILGEESTAAEPASELLPMAAHDASDLEPVAVRLPLPDDASSQHSAERQDEEHGGEFAATMNGLAVAPQRDWITKFLVGTAALVMLAGGAIGIYLASGQRTATTQNAVPRASTPANAIPSGESAALKIDPASIVTPAGRTFVLNGLLSHGHDIASVAIQIDYDPKLLQLVGVSEGAFLGKDGQQVILVQRDDSLAGILKISAQRPPGSPGISGDGPVFALSFQGRQKGTSTISIAPGAHDSQGRRVEVSGANALVTVD